VVTAIGGSGGDAADLGLDPYAALLLTDNYLGQVLFRLGNPLILRAEPVFALPYTLFLFLLGAQLYRAGAFTAHAAPTALQANLLRWGLGLGLPLNALALLPMLAPGLLSDQLELLLFFALRYGFSAVLALGYLALALWLFGRRSTWAGWRHLSNVGRTALSTYVSQSLALSLIFYGWGLGLGSQLSDMQIVALFLALALVQLWVAGLWVRHWGGGPLEKLRKRLEHLGATARHTTSAPQQPQARDR
jgi:uncharacterized protein